MSQTIDGYMQIISILIISYMPFFKTPLVSVLIHIPLKIVLTEKQVFKLLDIDIRDSMYKNIAKKIFKYIRLWCYTVWQFRARHRSGIQLVL